MLNTIIPELTICHAKNIHSKKQLLTLISNLVAEADSRLKAKHILESLTKREHLGSTNVGHGCAIPHARIQSLTKALCVLISLPEPINFDSEDHPQPTDIIFGLLVPEKATDEHLALLGELAEHIKQPGFCKHLRAATNDRALYKAATTKLSTIE